MSRETENRAAAEKQRAWDKAGETAAEDRIPYPMSVPWSMKDYAMCMEEALEWIVRKKNKDDFFDLASVVVDEGFVDKTKTWKALNQFYKEREVPVKISGVDKKDYDKMLVFDTRTNELIGKLELYRSEDKKHKSELLAGATDIYDRPITHLYRLDLTVSRYTGELMPYVKGCEIRYPDWFAYRFETKKERGLEAALNAAKAKQEQTVAAPERMTMKEATAVLEAAGDKIFFYSHENAGKSIENFKRNYEAGAKMLREFAEKHLMKQEFTGVEIARLAEYLLEQVNIYPREAGVFSNAAEMIQMDIDGDWKYDHARANMTLELMGIKLGGEELVEETGDDWYPARHIFNCSGMFGPERNIEIDERHNTSEEER